MTAGFSKKFVPVSVMVWNPLVAGIGFGLRPVIVGAAADKAGASKAAPPIGVELSLEQLAIIATTARQAATDRVSSNFLMYSLHGGGRSLERPGKSICLIACSPPRKFNF